MRGKVYALFLLAIASRASTIDPTQVYSSNGVSFHWIFEDGRGYVAQDWQGEQISGLNYGFTPWLVDDCDSGPAPVTHDPLPPIRPPAVPPTTITPEPGTLITGCFVLVVLALQIRPGTIEPVWIVERHSGRNRDEWRKVFSGNEIAARSKYAKISEALRQGGARLLAPDGRTYVAHIGAPRLRTRW